MDNRRFDQLARTLATRSRSRRMLLTNVVAGAFAAIMSPVSHDAVARSTCKKGKKACGDGCCPRRAPVCCKGKFCCLKGYHCCGNKCCKNGGGGTCKGLRAYCDSDSQCCGEAICFDNGCDGRVCCKQLFYTCHSSCECCGGLICDSGTCL
jgi:hypothetical protein